MNRNRRVAVLMTPKVVNCGLRGSAGSVDENGAITLSVEPSDYDMPDDARCISLCKGSGRFEGLYYAVVISESFDEYVKSNGLTVVNRDPNNVKLRMIQAPKEMLH